MTRAPRRRPFGPCRSANAENGRDLAKKLKEEIGNPELPLFLMSGSYKDKNFAREAMQTTGAAAFFSKPFNLDDIVKAVEGKLGNLVDAPLSPLHLCLTKAELTHKERIKAINDIGETHAFQLPSIMSLLMHPKVNGHLNIIMADGDVCGVGFLRGDLKDVVGMLFKKKR